MSVFLGSLATDDWFQVVGTLVEMAGIQISRLDSRRAALTGLIDYAGLFPPAQLDMDGAVAGYRVALASSAGWMVNRFICPARRLEELVGVLASTMKAGEMPWRLAVTASPDWVDSLTPDAGAVRMFTDAMASAASVETVEIAVPLEAVGDLRRLATDAAAMLRGFGALVFFEIPFRIDPSGVFDVLAALREDESRALGVKIRCGGLEADLFPAPGAVARFVAEAARRALPFKATAGLRHPFRHLDSATGIVHHGFINVLTAAAFAWKGMTVATLTRVLTDEDPSSFVLSPAGLVWREHTVDYATINEMRSGLFMGYGSCSFEEPAASLAALGMLPA